MPYLVLCRTLNREFKSLSVRFSFRKSTGKNMPMHGYQWHIEGNYNQRIPGVELDELLYEIRIVRLKNHKYFTVNKWFWQELYLVLAHEFKHAQQYAKRKNRMIFTTERKDLNPKADKYLCNYDEIDAHAYETAIEWKLKGGPLMTLATVRKYYKKCRRWAMPEWRRFIKKVYKYSHQV